MKDDIEVNVQNYCRICFEEKPGLVPCQKILVIEDFTCTIEEILHLLSSQELQAFSSYPSKICSTCRELAEATFALKIMYEKTSDVLRKLLTPQQEEIVKIEIEDSEVNGHINYDEQVYSVDEKSGFNYKQHKIEVEEFDEGDEQFDTAEYYHIEDDNAASEIDNVNIVKEGAHIEENVQFEEQNTPIQEEEIILQIVEPMPTGLTKNEKKNLYRKRRRMLEKQQEISMGQEIEKEIEHTINSSTVELKKPEDVTYLCHICFTEKTDPLEFRKHIHTHKVFKKYFRGKPKPLKARFVAQPRNNVTIFKIPDATHWCPYCNENLPALQFGIHLWNHERSDEFYCKICDRKFFKLRDYNLHKVRSHREEYPYKCEQCNQGFVIKYNYDCHMLKHTSKEEDLPYACQECPRKFSNSIHLWRHMHIHNGKGVYGSQYKKYKCHRCKQHFAKIENYDAHSCSRNNSQTPARSRKDHVCRNCDRTFGSYSGLYQHLRNVHGKKISQKMCDICGKLVRCYTDHMRKHTGEKPPPRVCNICGRSFTNISNYFRHYNTLHLRNKSYLCDVCGKHFKSYDCFKTHERIHIGNKCHICPVCGKGFLEKSYMRKHLVTHDKKKMK